ncbi:MAG: hypothetical protein ACI4V7_02310 [Succinivibrionaceae bacterium]
MNKSDNLFPLEKFNEILDSPKDYRLLVKVPFTQYNEISAFPIKLDTKVNDEISLVFLELKTTGSIISSPLIELAMVKTSYSISQNKITEITDVFHKYQNPNIPLSNTILNLTGISQIKLQNAYIHDEEVAIFLRDNPIIICHKAEIARTFFEEKFKNNNFLLNLRWVSSSKNIPWKQINYKFRSGNQQLIINLQGYFYDTLDSVASCMSLIYLFRIMPIALKELYKASISQKYRIYATKVPIETINILKSHKYNWDASKKSWYKDLEDLKDIDIEKAFLSKNYDIVHRAVQVQTISAYSQFKNN